MRWWVIGAALAVCLLALPGCDGIDSASGGPYGRGAQHAPNSDVNNGPEQPNAKAYAGAPDTTGPKTGTGLPAGQ